MTVRPATGVDAAAFVGVLLVAAQEGLVATEPPIDVGARVARLREEIEGDNAAGHWVLEDDGRVVGIAGAHETTVGGVLSLGIALLPEARGRGHGRALVEAVVAHAIDTGAHKVELEVWPDNERAIRLYESLGFTVEGVRRNHYRRRDGTLRSAVLMARLLHGADGGDAGAS